MHPEGRSGEGNDGRDAERRRDVDDGAEFGDAQLAEGEVGGEEVDHRRERGDLDVVVSKQLGQIAGTVAGDVDEIEMAGERGIADRCEVGADIDLDRIKVVGRGPGDDVRERHRLHADQGCKSNLH